MSRLSHMQIGMQAGLVWCVSEGRIKVSCRGKRPHNFHDMKFRFACGIGGALLLALALSGLVGRRPTTPLRALPPRAAEVSPAERDVAPPRAGQPDLPAPGVVAVNSNSPPATATNWLLSLLDEEGEIPKLPREVIDRWLASGRTNAEDLLAARQAGGGVEFLRMALTNFPNDPRVLFAASALTDDPEAMRQRLDRFKAADPDNALADYLSARDHFKNGRPAEGLADLLAANGKTGFQDYMLDAIQNAEDLYLQAGKSPAKAKALAATSALLPHLAQLKGLAREMATMQGQYLATGDTASAEQLAQMGLQLGRQLSSGEGSHTLLNQLVGIAIDRIVLTPLDAGRTYDFLPGTPREYVDQLNARRAGVRENNQILDIWMRSATDADIVSYFDRFKIYGEAGALAWLSQRQWPR
jgi:hypothetical protein